MKKAVRALRAIFVSVAVLAASGMASTLPAVAQEPLPSWNNTDARSRIINFVKQTVTEGGEGFVAPADRIAVFDNDGTLWTEQPYYIHLGFMLDLVKTLAPLHPEW